MSDPSVPYLVRDLARETSGWVQAEAVNARQEVETRLEQARHAGTRLAVGLLFAGLGLQFILGALAAWIALDLRLGWGPALGLIGIVVLLLGLSVLASARTGGPVR
jgi:hypothetical protein